MINHDALSQCIRNACAVLPEVAGTVAPGRRRPASKNWTHELRSVVEARSTPRPRERGDFAPKLGVEPAGRRPMVVERDERQCKNREQRGLDRPRRAQRDGRVER